MFRFTAAEQQLILDHIREVEAHDKPTQPYTICQLFENDDLYYLIDEDRNMPVDLREIDFSFTKRKFS